MSDLPVVLLGGGRDKDYHIDGSSHDASDVPDILMNFNFSKYYPETVEEIPALVKEIINNKKPCFVSLRK